VQCSRRLTDAEIETKTRQCLELANKGAVLVSPSISKGEKNVMRAAFEKGYPLIYLQENGFSDLAKPGGARMEACARGQLLILAPWEHHNERITISRNQCLSLNEMAKMLSWARRCRGHLVIWSFVKIENGLCQNRHYNINILFIYIVSNDHVSKIDFDQMTLTK
jgi:hypothetical protein